MTRFSLFLSTGLFGVDVSCDNRGLLNSLIGVEWARPDMDAPRASKQRVLPIYGIVVEPGFNNLNIVTGEVSYSIDIDRSLSTCVVTMAVEGTVEPFEGYGPVWTFEGKGKPVVNLLVGGVCSTSYGLRGRDDGAKLHITFRATPSELFLDRMWLTVPSPDGD